MENISTELKTSSATKKKLVIFCSAIGIVIILFVYYYRLKIELLVSNPKAFLDLFLVASQLKSFTILSTMASVSTCVLALFIEFLILGWDKSAIRKIVVRPNVSSRIDAFCFFLSVTRLYQALQLCVSLGITYFLSSILMKFMKFNLMENIHIPWVQPLLLFLLLDLKHYLEHRFLHTRKLWEIHSYHHSASEFTLFTNARGHLFEASVTSFFTAVFFAIMGAPLHEIIYVYAFREVYAYLIHSDINNKFGWIGRWILISPPAHKLHHSIDKNDYGRNFGTFFIWWDKLFGTYKEPSEPIKIGLTGDIYNQMNYFKGQWTVIKRWINSL